MHIKENIVVHAKVAKALNEYNKKVCLSGDPASNKLSDMVPTQAWDIIYDAIDAGIAEQKQGVYNV
jgi:hypothetical protein